MFSLFICSTRKCRDSGDGSGEGNSHSSMSCSNINVDGETPEISPCSSSSLSDLREIGYGILFVYKK